MGANAEIVIMIGFNYGYDNYRELTEIREELEDSNNFIIDGMCGNYAYYGKVLVSADVWHDGFESFNITPSKIEEIKKEASVDVKETLGLKEDEFNLELIVLNHIT